MRTTLIRRTTAAVAAAGLALTLAACGGDEEEPAADPAPPAEQAEDVEEETSAEPAPVETEEETSAEPAPEDTEETTAAPAPDDTEETSEAPTGDDEDAEAPGSGADVEVPQPGATVGLGETRTLHVQDGDADSDRYAGGVTETAVTEIAEGDASFFDSFDPEDAAEFEGYTPFFITSEHTVIQAEGDESRTNGEVYPGFEGLLDDGSIAQPVAVVSTGLAECPNEFWDEFVVGATATTCDVVLAPEGSTVVGAAWVGNSEIDGRGSENPYLQDPVVWE